MSEANIGTGPSTTPASEHKPFVPDSVVLPELTVRAVVLGTLLGIVFGGSSLYLVLKVGLTVSASVPVAVLSIAFFRSMSKVFRFRNASILENNIVQTAGSAGESIAFGVGVTMPALMLLGYEMDAGRVMTVAILGGLLGILMMIPLRRAFIVKKHGELKYPEGTACADVLVVGEEGGANAKTVFAGFGLSFVYQFLCLGTKLWSDTMSYPLRWFKNAELSMEANPALVGVGYIIGPKISSVMTAGGVLAALVLVPAIRYFGENLTTVLPPGESLIRDMDNDAIHGKYILYIGAGAVAAGGIISVFQAIPLMFSAVIAGMSDLLGAGKRSDGETKRTDRDMSMSVVIVGSLLLVLGIWSTSWLHNWVWWIPDLNMNPLGAILIVVFGFMFVTVSSRLTGEIGSSSNPISGMTVATLLLTCLIFVLLGWTGPEYRLTALSIAAIVCIAASNGGTTSQDLKTGFLVGATPKAQQWAILIGGTASAAVIGFSLILMNDAYTVYSKKNLPTPKVAIDMATVTEKMVIPKGDDKKEYFVWRAGSGNPQGVEAGKYLLSEKGEIKYIVDPSINGNLKRDDDGAEVTRYKAPKARLMQLITDGILTQKLEWTLVLLGVFIAVVLELSGIPSLPFAVGVYLPLSSSTPIFVGGMVRYASEWWGKRSGKAPMSDLETEMSPGSLMATGFIAGGSIAGVLVAFLSFSDDIPHRLTQWQYQSYVVRQEQKVEDVYESIAGVKAGLLDRDPVTSMGEKIRATDQKTINLERHQLQNRIAKMNKEGVAGKEAETAAKVREEESRVNKKINQLLADHAYAESTLQWLKDKVKETEEINKSTETDYIRVEKGEVLKLPKGNPSGKEEFTAPETMTLKDVSMEVYGTSRKAAALVDDNEGILYRVNPNVSLDLPNKKKYVAKQELNLAEVAKRALGSADKYPELLAIESNKKILKLLYKYPAGAHVKVPGSQLDIVIAFGLLIVILAMVGMGFLGADTSKTKKVN